MVIKSQTQSNLRSEESRLISSDISPSRSRFILLVIPRPTPICLLVIFEPDIGGVNPRPIPNLANLANSGIILGFRTPGSEGSVLTRGVPELELRVELS